MKKISAEMKEVLKSSGLFEGVDFDSINADEFLERCKEILPKIIDTIPTSNLDRNGYSIFTKEDLDGWGY